MRLLGLVIALMLLPVPSATAQSPSATPEFPYGLDPYKPSDAWWLRHYGSILVANTPILELRKLDPYVPSQAELIRQLGAGIPVWHLWGGLYPMAAPNPMYPTQTLRLLRCRRHLQEMRVPLPEHRP